MRWIPQQFWHCLLLSLLIGASGQTDLLAFGGGVDSVIKGKTNRFILVLDEELATGAPGVLFLILYGEQVGVVYPSFISLTFSPWLIAKYMPYNIRNNIRNTDIPIETQKKLPSSTKEVTIKNTNSATI